MSYFEKIVDSETGEETLRPYTKAEMVSQIKTVLNEIFEELGE